MTDVELVEQAKAGDVAAVDALHRRYASFVLHQAYRFGAGQDAEDVLQELFCRLVEGRGWHVRAEASPDGTLFKLVTVMTKRLIRDRPWRGKYHGQCPERVDELVPLWSFRQETPEDRALRIERTERMRWAFATLPQRLRQVATLRYVECLSGREIAERLHLSPATIPSYLAWIRDRMRPALATVYQLPPTGRYGYVRFGGVDRPRITSIERQNAKRRRARALERLAAAR
jgi:RNA polymerase sigma factor (sigma-70 family)